jgi:ATP-dependent DNA ligase
VATNSITLSQAAPIIGAVPSVVRRALNRFSLTEKRDGERVIPAEVVRLFARTRRHSGYLYPRNIETLDALLRAANAEAQD